MARTDPLAGLVDAAAARAEDDSTLAVHLHDVVRDRVRFGFTPWFDAADDVRTWQHGVGHCNPQARLFVGLLRRAGLQARYQPVAIDARVLHGLGRFPPQLSHVFTEVHLGERWIRLDSYIADSPLREAAVARLRAEDRVLGYGVHGSADGRWDGVRDAFSQIATPDLILETHAPVDALEDFYASPAYRHRIGRLAIASWLRPTRLLRGPVERRMNAAVEAVRVAGVAGFAPVLAAE